MEEFTIDRIADVNSWPKSMNMMQQAAERSKMTPRQKFESQARNVKSYSITRKSNMTVYVSDVDQGRTWSR
jgi:hypothetical protein